MRKTLFLLAGFLMLAGVVNAQTKIISGKITDSDNNPVPYVTIIIKGSNAGTMAKEDGSYTLTVPAKAKTLTFSSVGLQTKEVEIGSQSVINIILNPSSATLDEFVAIAYGNQKKTAFTGNAATVKAEVLENRPVASFEKALQGQATGITVQSASGQPGASSTVRIRGVGSFSASSTPLYVLDGVAITEGDLTQASTTANVLSTLDPKDIESITVLKDATAAGLYGSRAANGVIVITTKKGRAGKSSINFTANNGWSSIAVDRHQLLSGQEYYKYWWDYYNRVNLAAGNNEATAASKANTSVITNLQANPFNNAQPYGAGGVLNADTKLLYNTDWRDAVLNQGRTEEYGLNVSGGNECTKFYLSGGYFSQKGIVLASDFKRYSAKINLENATTSFLKIGTNTTLAYTDQNTPAGAGGAANPIRFSEIVSGIYPLYRLDNEGNPLPDPTGGYQYNYRTPVVFDYNPVGLGKKNIYQAKTVRGIVNGWAEVSFLKDFRLKSMATADYIDISETRYYNPVNGDGAAVKGRTNKYRPRDVVLTLTNTLNYGHQFGKHDIDVLLGQEAVKYRYENVYAGGTGFPFDGVVELDAAATPVTVSSDITEKRISSLFSRVNYSYDDRYYLTGSLRRDGSSIFGSDYRYGTFWTVGGGWRLGRELFLQQAGWIDELKLKASYGLSGNDRIGRYDRLGLYGTTYSYNGLPGIAYKQLENKQLHWEANNVMDLGVEFSFLKRFRTEFAYYTRWSKDVLFAQPLSYTTGFSTIQTNLADMKNQGVEVMLEANVISTKNFNWTSSINFTTTKNVIEKMTVDSVINPDLPNQRWKVGQDRYQWYIRDYAGVDPADGRPQWYQEESVNGAFTGKKVLTKDWNAATRYDLGSALPKLYGGFNNTLSYKEFDLSILTFFSVGGKIYDGSLAQLMHGGAIRGQQLATEAYKAWTKPGDVTDVPRFVDKNTDLGNNTSSRFLFDGSYIRLKNVTLGYRLSKATLERLHLVNARVYISAENLATWAKHKGVDPEMSISGTADNDVPSVKTFSVGLNIGL
jgi:TonB-linked SusC/RagA family outer membrane protein